MFVTTPTKYTIVPQDSTTYISCNAAESTNLQWRIRLVESSDNFFDFSFRERLNMHGFYEDTNSTNTNIRLVITNSNESMRSNRTVIRCVDGGLAQIPTIFETTFVEYGKW